MANVREENLGPTGWATIIIERGMLPIGTHVKTTRNDYEHGTIVGYGALRWPDGANINGDEALQPVYLVQVAEGSSSLRNACIVFRADQVRTDPKARALRRKGRVRMER